MLLTTEIFVHQAKLIPFLPIISTQLWSFVYVCSCLQPILHTIRPISLLCTFTFACSRTSFGCGDNKIYIIFLTVLFYTTVILLTSTECKQQVTCSLGRRLLWTTATTERTKLKRSSQRKCLQANVENIIMCNLTREIQFGYFANKGGWHLFRAGLGQKNQSWHFWLRLAPHNYWNTTDQ